MTNANYKTFSIVIHNPFLIDRIDEIAKKKRRSRSAQIEYILQEYIRENDDEFIDKHKD